MMNSKAIPTPIIIGLKSSNEDKGPKVNPTLFKRLEGSIMYLTMTRHDIMYGVSLILRFMETPKESHRKARKKILRCDQNKRFWY
jgi:histone deacetylase 1/2